MPVCLSCGRNAYEFVFFPCPNPECGSEQRRCKACRENDAKYLCKQCGFEGP